MHSLAVSIMIGFILLTQALGLTLSYSVGVLLLAAAVATIGLPHGSLDHQVGRKLMSGLPASISYLIFFAAYLIVAGAVIAGWYISPLLTTLAFFCLSAWHFGLEEDERGSISRIQWLAMIARGGMVIWVLAVFQSQETIRLLATILPSSNFDVASQIVAIVKFVAPALAALTLVDVITFQNGKRSAWLGISPKRLHLLRVSSFAILFATVDPLVSFGVYFCGWHSIRGLIHLREQFGLPRWSFLLRLAPISVVTLAIFAVGFLLSRNSNSVTPAVIQTLFIGLSAVAIPHLLLHVISDSIRPYRVEGAVS